jgi:hypothetical protein
MSLQQWVENGWLRVEPSSANEIRDLFTVVARSLKDAKVEAISDDLRFQAAFSAALNTANIALRSSGYRTRMQMGHHQKIVESLELTVQADAKLIHKLLLFSRKRNATSYDAAGSISQQERQQMIKVADELQNTVTTWLKRQHPELLKT